MLSVLSRSLTVLLILSGLIPLAAAKSVAPQQSASSPATGWTFVQDNAIFFCQGSGITGCSGGSFVGNMTPTVAGSVWVLEVQGPNNFTIASVTGGGGQWVHCPNCHATNPSGFNVDAWYNLSGNAGEDGSHLAFTLSGSAGSFISVNFEELLPPPGTTASYDTSGVSTPTNCSGTSATPCAGVSLTLSGTDAVISNPGGGPHASWNSWSAPYITTSNGSGWALNVSGTTAPTTTFLPCGSSHNTTCNPEFLAIAFKSSAGTFTPPTQQYSVVQIQTVQGPAQQSGGGLNCSAGCGVPLQATRAGDLLYVQGNSGQGGFISAVTCAPVACNSGSSAPVIPSGNSSSVCQRSYNGVPGIPNAALSCGYILSVPGGVTSLNVTANNSLAFTITVAEVASSIGGTFVLDTQGSTQLTTNRAAQPAQALALTGGNDVIFGAFWVNGGGNTPSYYAQPNLGWYCSGTGNTMKCNSANYTMFNQGEIGILLNSGPTAPSAFWVNPQNTTDLVTGAAFTVTGSSSVPNPPTGLTAVVN